LLVSHEEIRHMRRSVFAITIMLTASAATASDAIVRLSGWRGRLA
jgi:hypothetical protein